MKFDDDAILWEVIKLRDRAKRFKAHPKFIQRLEDRAKEEAQKVCSALTRGESVSSISELPLMK